MAYPIEEAELFQFIAPELLGVSAYTLLCCFAVSARLARAKLAETNRCSLISIVNNELACLCRKKHNSYFFNICQIWQNRDFTAIYLVRVLA